MGERRCDGHKIHLIPETGNWNEWCVHLKENYEAHNRGYHGFSIGDALLCLYRADSVYTTRGARTDMRLFGFIYLFLQMMLPQPDNAAAPQIPQDRGISAIKADVALVPVDVAVRNKEGGFVDHLQAKDFVVYDNGVAQQIDLFSHEEMPLDVALVVDNSTSEQPYLSELQAAARTALQQLNSKNDRMAIFLFGAQQIQLTSLTGDRLLLTHQLGRLPYGWNASKIKDALWNAALYLRSKSPHRRRAIILISDNYETVLSLHSYKETLDEMLEAGAILYSIRTAGDNKLEKQKLEQDKKLPAMDYPPGGATIIHPDSGSVRVDANPKEIALLAKETGGGVLDAESASELSSVLNATILSLKRSYTLGFYPSDKETEGSYHALRVQVNSNADYSVQARAGYYVPGSAASKIGQKVQASDARARGTAQNDLPGKNGWYFLQGHFYDPNPGRGFYSEFFYIQMREFLNRFTRQMDNAKKKNPIKNKPAPPALPHFDFSATAKRFKNPEGKSRAKIDLQMDAAQLFFDFMDDRYRAFLYIGVFQNNETVDNIKYYKVSYSEEEFTQAIQSKVSLSVTVSPPKHGDIQILVVNPAFYSNGVQSIQINP